MCVMFDANPSFCSQLCCVRSPVVRAVDASTREDECRSIIFLLFHENYLFVNFSFYSGHSFLEGFHSTNLCVITVFSYFMHLSSNAIIGRLSWQKLFYFIVHECFPLFCTYILLQQSSNSCHGKLLIVPFCVFPYKKNQKSRFKESWNSSILMIN